MASTSLGRPQEQDTQTILQHLTVTITLEFNPVTNDMKLFLKRGDKMPKNSTDQGEPNELMTVWIQKKFVEDNEALRTQVSALTARIAELEGALKTAQDQSKRKCQLLLSAQETFAELATYIPELELYVYGKSAADKAKNIMMKLEEDAKRG